MKKNLLSVLAASALLFAATSCSEDEELLTGGSSNNEKVSFQVEMDGTGPTSRALGDGTGADKLYYEVWDKNTNTNVYDAQVNVIDLGEGKRGATLSFDLVKGVPYDILFWAHNEAGSVFDASDLTAVTMKTTALKANMEVYDAFTAALNGYKVQSGSKTIVPLKRPFAQVNVGTTKEDWEKAEKLQVVIDQSLVTVKNVNTVYNVATSTASVPMDLTYALNVLVDKNNTFKVTKNNVETEYYYLGLNYMLADAEKEMKDNMEIELHDGEHLINTIKIANLPIQRNYRTNIIGNLLTSEEGFEVVVDPNFKDTHVVTVWDGGIKEPSTDTDGAYLITEAAELAWVADQVNHQGNDFSGKTIKLNNDIDLFNHGWTPIACVDSKAKFFRGTLDGNGKAIYNLNVEITTNQKAPAGLIGSLAGTVKDLTIDGAKVVGHGFLGAIAGYAYGNIQNCKVINAEIIATPISLGSVANVKYDDGDDVGAIVGQLNEGSYNVTGNSVENTTLTAYREIGGIVGTVVANNSANTQTITGNTIGTNVTIKLDQNFTPYEGGARPSKADNYVGSIRLSGTATDNCVTVDGNNGQVSIVQALTENTVPTVPEYDEQTKTYTADNAQEFLWLMHAVNGTLPAESKSATAPQSFEGETFKLACNVDLGNVEWTPIGEDKEKRFMGTFDGGNFTISNLKITKRTNDKPQAALFGALAGNVTIKDLILENVEIVYPGDGKDFYGAALVGTYYGNLTVNNVKVVNANITGNNKVAGLIAHDGASSTLNVDNCHVEYSTIASTDKSDGGNVGGLLGLFQGNGNATHTIKNSSVKNCIINGINSSNNGKRANSEFIGGITSKTGQILVITNCAIENNTFTDVQSNGSKVTYVSPYAPYEKYIGGARDEKFDGTVIVDDYQFVTDGCWLKDSEYYISNANGLKWVASTVNATTPYTPTIFDETTVYLTNDIDLKNEEWIPIGDDRSQRTEWHGTFDGQGYTIWNVKITKKTDRDDENKSSYGLFGNVKGTVKNLTVENVSISGAPKFIGALIGRLNNGLVENCHVKNSSVECNNWTIGGLVGQWNDGKISGCSVEETTVKGYAGVGAIAGLALNKGERTIENCSVKNSSIVKNGSFGGNYDKMFGAVLGATYNGELTVYLTGCSVENTTVLGEKSNVLCGYVAEGDKLTIDGYEMVSDGLLKKGVEYNVYNANGLATLNTMMANKTAGRDVVVNLTADIDFNGKTWTPVDSHADTAFEIAEINGNKHTISNLNINGQAMFTRFAGSDDVVIKNVTFDNATVTSSAINTSILTVQSYQNILLDNVDVKNSSITGSYKVAPLIATVYNESTSTVTATLKNCDVETVTVKAETYDFCTTGMVAFVYADDNDKIEFENCTVKDVKLIAPNDSYKAHAAIYTTGSGSLFNEVEGVTVTNVTFEALQK